MLIRVWLRQALFYFWTRKHILLKWQVVWHSRDRSVACGIRNPQTIKIYLDFIISSLFCESFSLTILGKMVITFDFPLVLFFSFFVCLFLKRKIKIYFISGFMYCRGLNLWRFNMGEILIECRLQIGRGEGEGPSAIYSLQSIHLG